MRQRLRFSNLILSVLLPCASALPQSANSTQPVALKSKTPSTKWTEGDERGLLVKANRGDASSQMWLACAYEQGWFGKTNFPEALKWFRRSAEQGDPDAQNALGQMYEDGEGVTQNYVLAAKWYRKAAEHVPNLGGADKGETIWECSIWMVKEFPRTTFKLICGSGWLILNQTQTCLLPKLT